MKISKVLKKIMRMFDLTMYRIAKEAGLSPISITRAVNESSKDMTISTLQKIADGLERIDPIAKEVLFSLLKMPDDLYMELEGESGRVLENPKTISDIIYTLNRLGYIQTEKLESDRKKYQENSKNRDNFAFEIYISVQVNNDRINRENPDSSEIT